MNNANRLKSWYRWWNRCVWIDFNRYALHCQKLGIQRQRNNWSITSNEDGDRSSKRKRQRSIEVWCNFDVIMERNDVTWQTTVSGILSSLYATFNLGSNNIYLLTLSLTSSLVQTSDVCLEASRHKSAASASPRPIDALPRSCLGLNVITSKLRLFVCLLTTIHMLIIH